MSQREHFADRFTGVDEILESIEANTRSMLAAEGIVETDGPNHVVNQPFEYAAIPDDYYPLAFPPGITVIDFMEGTISHSDPNGLYPDAGRFSDTVRTFEEMTRDLPGANLQGLRALAIEVDQPVAVALDDESRGWINVNAGAKEVIKSLGFQRVRIKCPYSYRIRAGVSTRVGAFESTNTSVSAPRAGYHTNTGDGWERVNWWPPGMDTTLSASAYDHTDYWHDQLQYGGFEKAGVIIHNDSAAANAIDARIVARDDFDGGTSANPEWYQIGDSINEATGSYLAQGDHYHWMVEVPHHQLAVEVTNQTNGDTYTVNGDLTLGGR